MFELMVQKVVCSDDDAFNGASTRLHFNFIYKIEITFIGCLNFDAPKTERKKYMFQWRKQRPDLSTEFSFLFVFSRFE